MVSVKEMSFGEKYTKVQDSIKLEESFVPSFVQERLSEKSVDQLREIWGEGIKLIPENASDEEKYEIAYSNWIWMGRNVFKFVREHLGEEGIEQLKHSDIEALKRENASPALFFLAIIRVLSPGLAFSMTAKKIAYQLQWLSPFSVSELNRQRMLLDIPQCKLLDFTDSEDLCRIG
jgi:hypothetical protein